MNTWENSFAASFMYHDLADCSIGALPVVTELEDAKCEQSKNELEKKKQEIKVMHTLRKVSAFLVILISMVTKVM